MTIRHTLGYGDFLVTCFWGLKNQPRPRRRPSALRRQPLLTGVAALCRLVPAMATVGQ